jgi:DNA adenine methylase
MPEYIRPFLKWAGGKHAILPNILPHFPAAKRLVEPFVGSGCVFINCDYRENILGERNQDLVNVYTHLAKEGDKFIRYCKKFFTEDYNTADKYYELRETFNTTKRARLKAALFIYFNRHGFNGLCRYNSKGQFNVPFAHYKKSHFPEATLQSFYQKMHNANIVCQDFRETMTQAKKGDVVYCDPPYVPLSETAMFTGYAANGFDEQDQQDLNELARACQARGITTIISNHDTPVTRQYYKGAEIISFPVQRRIGNKSHHRPEVKELIAIFSPE